MPNGRPRVRYDSIISAVVSGGGGGGYNVSARDSDESCVYTSIQKPYFSVRS